MGLVDFVAHRLEEVEPRLQILHGGVRPGVGQDLERGGGRVAVHDELGGVGARRADRTVQGAPPHEQAVEVIGLFVAQVPVEVLQAILDLELVGLVSGVGGESPDGFPLSVQEGEFPPLGAFRHLEMQAHARRMVGPLGQRGLPAATAEPDGGVGLEEAQAVTGCGFHRLPQNVEVVEDPEAPALCGDDQVVVLEGEVGDGNEWQVVLQRLPMRTVVGADVESELGAGVQQAWHGVVRADDAGEVALVDALGDGRP